MRIFPGLLFLSGSLLVGCVGISPGLIGQDEKTDPMQAAIFKQAKGEEAVFQKLKALSYQADVWVPNPAPVLEEIPLGSPVARARAVMQRHSFRCVDLVTDDKRPFLSCTATQKTRWLGKDAVRVEIYYQAGEVSDVKVITFHK
jgi:hypothetical protein